MQFLYLAPRSPPALMFMHYVKLFKADMRDLSLEVYL